MEYIIYGCLAFVSAVVLSVALAKDTVDKTGEIDSDDMMTCVLQGSGFSIIWPITWLIIIIYNLSGLILRLLTSSPRESATASEPAAGEGK